MSTTSELAHAYQDEAIHDRWEAAYRTNSRQDAFNDAIMERVVPYLDIPCGGRVLDAGCGIGDHTIRLARRGFQCVGIDLSAGILEEARQRAARCGVADKIEFICHGLEDMSAFKESFDAIHCRGVLMHIPRWQDAVGELCRLLKPGGRIVIIENNHRAVETYLVRLARVLGSTEGKTIRTPGGLELHRDRQGQVPLTRIANVPCLVGELKKHGVRKVARVATEFWDIRRFPTGLPRNAAVAFNRLWFSLRLPALFSSGNAIIGERS